MHRIFAVQSLIFVGFCNTPICVREHPSFSQFSYCKPLICAASTLTHHQFAKKHLHLVKKTRKTRKRSRSETSPLRCVPIFGFPGFLQVAHHPFAAVRAEPARAARKDDLGGLEVDPCHGSRSMGLEYGYLHNWDILEVNNGI